jgi:SulP family sulfate permease
MLKPKLFTTLKDYNKEQFIKDLISGTIVGIVALPLAIAFAIASGVSPEKGLFTAIIAGFIISFLGGSKVQIGGPTGAFVVIVYGIVQKYGVDGLTTATLIAGAMLIIMGFARLGSIIKYIPHPLIVGFTTGIALIIFTSQIKDFFGLTMGNVPSDFIEKIVAYSEHIANINFYAMIIAAGTIVISMIWTKLRFKIPGSLVALILSTVLVQIFSIPVETIGSRFGAIPSSLPAPTLPHFNFSVIQKMIQPAFTIALLGGIESLLSAVVADGMIGGSHRSNMELIAQGVANIFSSIFGGIPATGAIARTATNVKNGGRTPIAGMVHAVILLLIMLFFGKWATEIPMACLAGILVVVAFNMSEYQTFIGLAKGPKGDAAILLTTFFLTVLVDLTVAIEIGMVMSAFIFMRRMSNASNVSVITNDMNEIENLDDANAITKYKIPNGIEVFEISGPFFFGAAYKFKESMKLLKRPPKVLIIRMRYVPVIDATGLHTIEEVFHQAKSQKTILIIAGLVGRPLEMMEQTGLADKIGKENIFDDLEAALHRAEDLIKTP